MKKIFLTAALGSLSIINAQKFEVTAGYGTGSLFGLSDSMIKGATSAVAVALGGKEPELPSSNGVFTLSANLYNADMKWRYGVEFNLESFNETKTFYNKQTYFSFLPKVDYFWSDSDKKLRLYSGISVGALFRNAEQVDGKGATIKDNETFFAFNIMPIGIRYGGDFGVFLEPNIGTRGFVQAGVSYAF